MRARFVGDPSDGFSGPETITVLGLEFTKDVWRPVPNTKLASHSHFEFDTNADDEPEPTVDDLKARLNALGVQFHHAAGLPKLSKLWHDAMAHLKGEGA